MFDQPQTDKETGEENSAKARVFLSYSRKDTAFTRRLAEALAKRGYAPDFDQSAYDPANIDTGISAEDEWWQRLQDMIAAADVMLIVGSPDLAASKVCAEEIAHARNLGKRIIPILFRQVDFASAPPRLKSLNFKIRFDSEGEAAFAAALDELCAALDVDVAWHRESARLTTLAARWDNAGRPEDLLLGAADDRAVGTLLERRPAGVPEPAAILLELREVSRARLDAEETKQRRIIGRGFVKPAQEALKDGPCEHALRLAAAGVLLAKDLGFDPGVDTQLWGPAARAIFENRTSAVLKGHAAAVSVAAFSPDGRRIVTASDDATARIWDAATGRQIAALRGHTNWVRSAAFSPDGQRIVTASYDNSARLWDAATGKQIAALEGHTGTAWSAAFSPDGQRIVTASDDNSARLWDAATGKEIAHLEGHANAVNSAAFSPDGQRIVTASDDNSARIWDAAMGHEVARLEGHTNSVRSASFSPDGRRIVTASWDHSARIWDAATGNQIAALHGHTDSVRSAAFSPDGRRIVTASGGGMFTASDDNSARLWDAATGHEVARLEGHTEAVSCATFSPDGRRIVTASWDNSARIWDAATGNQIAALRGHTDSMRSAAFSPDGQRIVTASDDNSARIWDAAMGHEVARLEGHTEAVSCATFSPDGRRIVTASWDNSARIWDAATGNEVARLEGHTGAVSSAAFSPDGRRIVTASYDDTARIWDVPRSATIGRSLSVALTAALAHGVGRRTDRERADLLMQDAEDDLFAEALKQLGRTEDDHEVAAVAAELRAPLHPNCYLSPTQFAEKFGKGVSPLTSIGDVEREGSDPAASAQSPSSTSSAAQPRRRIWPFAVGLLAVLLATGLATDVAWSPIGPPELAKRLGGFPATVA